MKPKLAVSTGRTVNNNGDVEFAIDYDFEGVDWSFTIDSMPFNNKSRNEFISQVQKLQNKGIEVRFHAPFLNVEIGHRDDNISGRAMELYFKTLELVEDVAGKFLTLHIGLGSISDKDICLVKVEENLKALKQFGLDRGITISLENLRDGPTSYPEQWMEMLDLVDLPATFDFGHAKGCNAVAKGLWTPNEIMYQVKERLIHAHIYKEEKNEGHIAPETIHDLGIDLLDALMETSCRWWVIELSEKRAVLHTKEMLTIYIESLNNH